MAQPHDDYERILPVSSGITEEQYQKQVATVEEYRGDCSILSNVANKYRTQLEEEGLDGFFIDDLIPRANAFAVASSIVDNAIANREESESYIATKNEAYPFRRKMFNYGKFALKGHKEEYAKLTQIIEGSGDLDLADDFLGLHTLYSANISKFSRLKKFTPDLLEKGLEYHQRIYDLYGKVNCPEDEKAEMLRIERQMFVHMREAVQEIRMWAELTFAEDKEILKEFHVSYYRDY